MAATLTETKTFGDGSRPAGTYINRIALAWVSHTDGTVALPTGVINGTILKVEFKPDGGGTQPSDLYDVTITDTAGIDILAGQGANLSNATATAVVPGVPFKDGTTTSTAPCVVAESLTLNVSNAGNAKGGQVILYVR